MSKVERNARIIALRKAGVGPRQIARELGVTPQVVAGVLHRNGLTKEETGRGYGATAEFKALVCADAEQTSQGAAARKWGVDQSMISRWLRAA